ncbi:Uncharacterised protein [Salmonella enterica subsp. enterica serovar Typhi]|nr:Uncharacterised protein [Salmonella enterica subsp. enterica serovar Typhi]
MTKPVRVSVRRRIGRKSTRNEVARVTTAGTPTRATASAQRAAGGWSRPLLVRVGEGRSRQFVVNHLHRRADDPFHDAAIVRLSQRAIVQPDAMLLATPAQGLALELGRVV